ncbi:MAG: 1,6-anhydro-N-acetylmuramyl-L-alanine amidase AmpD [Pseudomonadota bacterium]
MSCDYSVDPATGLIAPASQCPSPNQDERPAGTSLDLIVIHCISLPPGEYGGDFIERFFCNRLPREAHPYFDEIGDLTVSSHLLLKRDGSLVQFVPFGRRAWHAGASSYLGRERCNDFSVGIELAGTDTSPFEDAQYLALTAVIAALGGAYPSLSGAPVVGHEHIAPGRKTDPGPCFDWSRLECAATMPKDN